MSPSPPLPQPQVCFLGQGGGGERGPRIRPCKVSHTPPQRTFAANLRPQVIPLAFLSPLTSKLSPLPPAPALFSGKMSMEHWPDAALNAPVKTEAAISPPAYGGCSGLKTGTRGRETQRGRGQGEQAGPRSSCLDCVFVPSFTLKRSRSNYLFCVRVCLGPSVHATACLWRLEENLQESVLSKLLLFETRSPQIPKVTCNSGAQVILLPV